MDKPIRKNLKELAIGSSFIIPGLKSVVRGKLLDLTPSAALARLTKKDYEEMQYTQEVRISRNTRVEEIK